jgi:hypothetical protein
VASMGNPYGRGGGFAKSPLAGSMLGRGQVNSINLVKNDIVDPLGQNPDAQETRVVVLPATSIIAVTVAELTFFDPGIGTGGASSSDVGAGDGAGASGDGAASGPSGGGGVGGTGDGPTGGDAF